MPDVFGTTLDPAVESTLRAGTEQVVDTLAAPSAAQVRAHNEVRMRRRRVRSIALCAAAAVLVGGMGLGVRYGLGAEPGRGAAAAGTSQASASAMRSAGASASASASASPSTEATGPVSVRLNTPAAYASGTANKVQVTITNPGPARAVIVEFDTTGSAIFQWAEACDAGVDGGCDNQSYAANPLKVTTGKLGTTPVEVVRFSLALPHGTNTYSVWVNPPREAAAYEVRVLDDRAVTEFGRAQSSQVRIGFPTLTTKDASSGHVSRGGHVGFDVVVSNPTTASYVDLRQFGTVKCYAGQSQVDVSSADYSLEWYTGNSWAKLVNPFGPGSMAYDLDDGKTITKPFRLIVSGSMPSDVTSCRVTLTVAVMDSTATSPPYYNTSEPYGQTAVDFGVN